MRGTLRMLAAAAMLALSFQAAAQDNTLKTASSLSDYLGWKSLWLGSANPAAMLEFKNVCDSAHLSEAAVKCDFESGSYRSAYSPKNKLTGGVEANSIMNAGKAVIAGRFGYEYAHGKKSRWRGLVDPYESAFMLADSIPGSISDEKYSMMAAAAVPIGGNWSFGIETDYDVSLMAKHIDLRNKNTRMEFRAVPSVRWTSDVLCFGAALDCSRYTEKVEYIQVDQSSEKYLFEFSGAWACRSLGFSSAETSRIMTGWRIGGEFETSLEFVNGWSLYNEFYYGYRENSQSETGYNGLRHGDSKSTLLSDNLYFVFSPKSRLGLHFSSAPMYGYRFIQRQELDPDSGVRRYVSYGSAVPCYKRDDLSLGLTYELRPDSGKWELSADAGIRRYEEKAYEGTVRLNDIFFSTTELSVELKKHFFIGESVLSVVPAFSVRTYGPFAQAKVDPVMPDYTLEYTGSTFAGSGCEIEKSWLQDGCVGSGIALRWARRKLSVTADYSRIDCSGASRNYASMILGIRF